MIAPETLARLKEAAGPRGFIDDPEGIAPYCTPFRDGWIGETPLVLRPSTTAEVAALVRICAETRTPIVPQGGNTGMTGASQPHNGNAPSYSDGYFSIVAMVIIPPIEWPVISVILGLPYFISK